MSTTVIKLTTLKPHRYGRRRVIGEEYEVSREADARILVARGFARVATGQPKAQAVVPKPHEFPLAAVSRGTREKKEKVAQPQTDKPKRAYKRRDKQAE